MDSLPLATKLTLVQGQLLADPPQFQASETSRAVQLEHSFTAIADNVHMSWPMIVRVNYDPQSSKRKIVRMFDCNLNA